MEKAKQTLINAGYQPAEVQAAEKKVPASTTPISKPVTTQPTSTEQSAQKTEITTTATSPETPKKKISKNFLIILIVSSGVILAGAALLGIFWNKIFGGS